jgi:predicted enzyme related to lactoylglutathione lyase
MFHGKFVWYELLASDAPAAEAFYRQVVGWGAQDSGNPEMRYTMLTAGGTPVAGLMTLPDEARKMGARPGWIGYIAVDDVDAVAARTKQAGGAVHRGPADIPNIGRFAVVADPQGAVFALFKGLPGDRGEPAKPGTPGHAGWHELLAANGETAFDFYSGLFGWKKGDPFDMGAMGIYQLFTIGDQPSGGMMTKPAAVPAPFWLYYFNVESIDAAVARVEAGGGKIANGPHQVPGGSWIVQCLDSQGVLFALVAPRK